ncbi:MAG TPA: hypothetical protein VFV38_50110 [Ktedonobacteraceae bacterium]|nr:hypothetical protein [Ktedonobacteraceae bacterium]
MNQSVPEPFLTYNQQAHRWEGSDGEWFIWMDDSTFQAYVTAWQEGERFHRSASVQLEEATRHCAHFRYWDNCELNYDRRVHKVFRGGTQR